MLKHILNIFDELKDIIFNDVDEKNKTNILYVNDFKLKTIDVRISKSRISLRFKLNNFNDSGND